MGLVVNMWNCQLMSAGTLLVRFSPDGRRMCLVREWGMMRARVLLLALCLAVPLVSVRTAFAVQPTGTFVAECPKDPLPLPSDAIMQAAEAVRKALPMIYHGLDTRRAMVQGGDLAHRNIVHGVLAKQHCGETAWHRTAVVYVGFPKSFSQGAAFVSQVKGSWKVWGLLQMPVMEVESGRPARPTGPAVDVDGCPENPLPLPPDAIAHATKSALRAVPTLYQGLNTQGTMVERAALASADQRGPQVKLQCGSKVWRRTVVVHLYFPIPEKVYVLPRRQGAQPFPRERSSSHG